MNTQNCLSLKCDYRRGEIKIASNLQHSVFTRPGKRTFDRNTALQTVAPDPINRDEVMELVEISRDVDCLCTNTHTQRPRSRNTTLNSGRTPNFEWMLRDTESGKAHIQTLFTSAGLQDVDSEIQNDQGPTTNPCRVFRTEHASHFDIS